MCGIIGKINNIVNVGLELIYGLKQMEYRGYDSAGILFAEHFELYKSIGSLSHLEKAIAHKESLTGIAHTRWATHGEVSIANTHPIKIHKYAIVHNGIIEDTEAIKQKIQYKPKTQTDTEILLAYYVYLRTNNSKENALKLINERIKGSYAACILEYNTNEIIWMKKGFSPLILAKTSTGNAIASDSDGLQNIEQIEDITSNGFGYITKDKIEILKGETSSQKIKKYIVTEEKNHQTWLEEEIYEQIKIHKQETEKTLTHNFSQYHSVKLIACGSSYFASEIGAIWLEEEGISASAIIASEWNSSNVAIHPKQLCIFISQSGYTADTLSALLKAKGKCHTLSLTNKEHSPIKTNANTHFPLNAGTEKSVASSKSFTSQIIKLYQLIKGPLPSNLHTKIEQVFKIQIKPFIDEILKAKDIIFLGKNKMSVLAKEAMLKTTEIAYLNAFAYPAGELKHGYIAKITEETITIVFAPQDEVLLHKTISNAQEILTRKGKVLWISHENHINTPYFIQTPQLNYDEATFCYLVLLQKLALELAKKQNLPIDKPRNLAKSVTVE